MSEHNYIFPPGSSVVMKLATLLSKEDTVIWGFGIHKLGVIWDRVMTNYKDKDLPTDKLWQFYIKSIVVVIGSKVMYGRGRGRKEGRVLGLDPEGKKPRFVTIGFPGNNRKTVLYNSCTMVGLETLTPIDFDLYHLLKNEYSYRNKPNWIKEGKLKHMIAPHYSIKEVNGVLFACDPMKPEDRKAADIVNKTIGAPNITNEEAEKLFKREPLAVKDQEHKDENTADMLIPIPEKLGPGLMGGIKRLSQSQMAEKMMSLTGTEDPVTIKYEKRLLTIPLEDMERQLFDQGYKLIKL